MDNSTNVKSSNSSDIEIIIEMKSKDEILKKYLEPDRKKSLLKMVIKSLESKLLLKQSKQPLKLKKSSAVNTKNIIPMNKKNSILQVFYSKANIKTVTPEILEEDCGDAYHIEDVLTANDILPKQQRLQQLPLQEDNKISEKLHTHIYSSKPKKSISKKRETNFDSPKISRSLPTGLDCVTNFNTTLDDNINKKHLIRKLILEAMDVIFEQNDINNIKTYLEPNLKTLSPQPTPTASICRNKKIVRELEYIKPHQSKNRFHKMQTLPKEYYDSLLENSTFESGDNTSTTIYLGNKNRKEDIINELFDDVYKRLLVIENQINTKSKTTLWKHSAVQCNDGSLECIKENLEKKHNIMHHGISCNTSNTLISVGENIVYPKLQSKQDRNEKDFNNLKERTSSTLINTSNIKLNKDSQYIWDGKEVNSSFDLKQKVDEIINDKLNQLQLNSSKNLSPASTVLMKSNPLSEKLLHNSIQKSRKEEPSTSSSIKKSIEDKLTSVSSNSKSIDTQLNKSEIKENLLNSQSIFSIMVTNNSTENLSERRLSLRNKISKFVSNMSLKIKSSKVLSNNQEPQAMIHKNKSCFPKFWKHKYHTSSNSNHSTSNESNLNDPRRKLDNLNGNRSFLDTRENLRTKIVSETSENSIKFYPKISNPLRLVSSNTSKSSFEDAVQKPSRNVKNNRNSSMYSNDSFDIQLKYISNKNQLTSDKMKNNTIYIPNFLCKKYGETTSKYLNKRQIDDFEYDELIKIYEKKPNNQFVVKRNLNSKTNSKTFKQDSNFLKLYDFLTTSNDPNNYRLLTSLYRKMIDKCNSSCFEEQVVLFKENNCNSKISVQSDDSIDVSITLSELRTLIDDSEARKYLDYDQSVL